MRSLMALSVHVAPLELPLVHPFKIARGEESVASGVLLRLRCGDLEGLGEANPIERYGETVASVLEYFRTHELAAADPYRLEALLHAGIPAAARAGLDLALHDLIGKDLGKPLYALLGLDPSLTPVTSFTIGIADPQTTLEKLAEIGDHPVLKVKLGGAAPADESRRSPRSALATAEPYASTQTKAGTSTRRSACSTRIERFDIEFCEQPVEAGHPEHLRAISERVSIPIVADEDALVASDLPLSARMRCGGEREAR